MASWGSCPRNYYPPKPMASGWGWGQEPGPSPEVRLPESKYENTEHQGAAGSRESLILCSLEVRVPFLALTPETQCSPCSRDLSHNCPTPLASKDPCPVLPTPCCAAQVTVQPMSNPSFSGASVGPRGQRTQCRPLP